MSRGTAASLPLPGARIVVTGEGTEVETVTRQDGSYELRVPVGAYTVRADVSDELLARARPVEILDPRGCAQADIHIRSNGRVAGRLLTAGGEPIPHLSLGLYRLERDSQLFSRAHTTTDGDGEFEFTGIAAHDYFVGVNVTEQWQPSWPRSILYPGTRDPAEAAVITVPPRARAVAGDFVLPASVVLVRGIVRGGDGRPVEGAGVQLLFHDPSDGRPGSSSGGWTASAADGSFHFLGLAGSHYRVVAETRDVDGVGTRASRPRRVEGPVFEATGNLPRMEFQLPD